MPIVDGLTSTKMIRSFEKANFSHSLSTRALLNGRVPIIAVSASLLERDRQTYIDSGFDGWILKPISFSRLSEIMTGLVDENVRRKNLYKQGGWELGGWFEEARKDVIAGNTQRSSELPPEASETINADSVIGDTHEKEDVQSKRAFQHEHMPGKKDDEGEKAVSKSTSLPELGSKVYKSDTRPDVQISVTPAQVRGDERHSSPAPMTPETKSEDETLR